MTKPTIRILWSASLGLGLAWGLAQGRSDKPDAKPNWEVTVTFEEPAKRSEAAVPAAVTFESEPAQAPAKSLPSAVTREAAPAKAAAPAKPVTKSFTTTISFEEPSATPEPIKQLPRIQPPAPEHVTEFKPAAALSAPAPTKPPVAVTPPSLEPVAAVKVSPLPSKPTASTTIVPTTPPDLARPAEVKVSASPHKPAVSKTTVSPRETDQEATQTISIKQAAAEQLAPPPEVLKVAPHLVDKVPPPAVLEPPAASRSTTITIDIPKHESVAAPAAPNGPLAQLAANPTTQIFDVSGDLLLGEAPMLGRNDQNNRFNIFNNQSALVQSRVWFGYHHEFDYNPALQLTGAARKLLTTSKQSLAVFLEPQFVSPGIMNKSDEDIYRFGIEYGFNPAWSLVVQAEYISQVGADAPDNWSSPQFMLKRVVYQEDRAVISLVFAVEPQTEVKRGEFKEDATRIYPGLLWYEEIGANFVLQGGVQVGIPFGSQPKPEIGTQGRPYTLDYAISAGYWLYRHPDLLAGNPDRPGWRPFISDGRPWLLGMMTQIEILGKSVLGGDRMDSPFRLDNPADKFTGGVLAPAIFEYIEPRNVVDVTAGCRLILPCHTSLSGATSVPLTGARVRQVETFVYLSHSF